MKTISATRRSLWRRYPEWVNNHTRIAVVLLVALVLIAAGLLAAAWFLRPAQPAPAQKKPAATTPPPAETKPPVFYSPLTGATVPDEATSKRVVTAIMLENSPSSRPQSGLKPAGIVFEAIAEGGITRYLTLHQENRPQLVGPVRSLRPYYIDWMAPFDSPVAHVGGSANALKTIRNGSFRDIDQFFNGGSYWRATDRVAPHNVYTSFDKLDALNQAKGFTSSTFTPFPRKVDAPLEAPTANAINIEVSSATYNVAYNYEKSTNSYLRTLGGQPHTDREAGRITPKVVIAIKVPVHTGWEDGNREQMTTNGFNQAYIFQDGGVVEGFWRKTAQKTQMQFYDKAGRPIALNPGQTWVTVIAPNKRVTWQ